MASNFFFSILIFYFCLNSPSLLSNLGILKVEGVKLVYLSKWMMIRVPNVSNPMISSDLNWLVSLSLLLTSSSFLPNSFDLPFILNVTFFTILSMLHPAFGSPRAGSANQGERSRDRDSPWQERGVPGGGCKPA